MQTTQSDEGTLENSTEKKITKKRLHCDLQNKPAENFNEKGSDSSDDYKDKMCVSPTSLPQKVLRK